MGVLNEKRCKMDKIDIHQNKKNGNIIVKKN